MQYNSPAQYICNTMAPSLLHHPLSAGPPFGSPKGWASGDGSWRACPSTGGIFKTGQKIVWGRLCD
eukprot:8702214-Pyramimonas_sp.AAC.1